MGEEIAGAADGIYKSFVEAAPQHQRMREQGVLDMESSLLLLGAHVGGLRQAMLFLAQQMEDPHPLNEALLDSLRAFVDGEDTATEPAG